MSERLLDKILHTSVVSPAFADLAIGVGSRLDAANYNSANRCDSGVRYDEGGIKEGCRRQRLGLMRVYDKDLFRHIMTSKVLIEPSGIPNTVRK